MTKEFLIKIEVTGDLTEEEMARSLRTYLLIKSQHGNVEMSDIKIHFTREFEPYNVA